MINIVKIILEKEDIEKMIKERYQATEITGIQEDIEIIIKVEELVAQKPVPRVVPPRQISPQEPIVQPVLTPDGTIDANASKMVNENRKETVPGKAMGQVRGRLPTF